MQCNEMLTKSILIVDDEPDMRIALTKALSCSGYSVESASSGFEALEKFKREKFGIVITDLKMPEMTGMNVLQEVKKISPQVPVIILTAYGTVKNAVEAMKEGASDYILKPFSADTLEAAVKKTLINSNGKSQLKPMEVGSGVNSETKKIVTREPKLFKICLLYTSPSPRDLSTSRMPSSA